MKIPFLGTNSLLIIGFVILFILTFIALKKSNKKKSKIKEYIWGIIFFVYTAIAYFAIEKMFISFILGAVITGAIALVNYLSKSVLNDIKSKENRKKGIKNIVICLLVALGAMAIFLASLSSISSNKSPRCIECGRNAMWTDTGYCYSCYNGVKNKIEDSMK